MLPSRHAKAPTLAELTDDERLRYSRHLLLEGFGEPEQLNLKHSSALVIGLGGLGCPAAMYLAAAGVGHLVLADDDRVDATNLQRQIAHRETTVGSAKATSAAQTLQAINSKIQIDAVTERLQGARLADLVGQADVVLDCSDNFSTRHAVNRACVHAKVPLVSAAAVRTGGQLLVIDSRQPQSACYQCVFPEQAGSDDVHCATMGIFAPLVGMVGTMQAGEALKLLSGFSVAGTGQLVMVQVDPWSMTSIAVARDTSCPVCGHG
jgi:molybdopterin/thiamine biosynthesis adenylyltransferase